MCAKPRSRPERHAHTDACPRARRRRRRSKRITIRSVIDCALLPRHPLPWLVWSFVLLSRGPTRYVVELEADAEDANDGDDTTLTTLYRCVDAHDRFCRGDRRSHLLTVRATSASLNPYFATSSSQPSFVLKHAYMSLSSLAMERASSAVTATAAAAVH